MKAVIIIKPDAIERNLLGWCVACVEAQGKILKMQLLQNDPPLHHMWRQHYAEHKEKDFYPGLIKHMVSGPIVVILADIDIAKMRMSVSQARRQMGCHPGPANLMHCSDSPESAEREVALWF